MEKKYNFPHIFPKKFNQIKLYMVNDALNSFSYESKFNQVVTNKLLLCFRSNCLNLKNKSSYVDL